MNNGRSIREDILNKLGAGNDLDYIMIHNVMDFGPKIINFIAGLLIVTVMMLLTIFIAMELMYLILPVYKERVTNSIMETEGIRKKTYTIVLHDAILAYKDYIDGGCESNVLWLYLKRKIKVVFIYGICISVGLGYGQDLANTMSIVISQVLKALIEAVTIASETISHL